MRPAGGPAGRGNRTAPGGDLHSMRPLSRPALLLLTTLVLTACAGAPPPSTDVAVSSSSAGQDGTGGGEHVEHVEHVSGSSPADASTASRGKDPGHAHPDIAESGVGTKLRTGDGFGNRLREAPAAARPGVALRVVADPAGGWTVQAATTGFGWAPTEVNTPAKAARGHAHLYAGKRKVARTYASWSFLSAGAAEPGDVLTVVLYANDHTAWAVRGKAVSAQVVLPAMPTRSAA